MDFEQIHEQLRQMIDSKRYQHTLGVEETAVRLAEYYHVPEKKARQAALLHDCGKGLSKYHLLQRLEGSDIVVDDMEREVDALLHAPVGAIIAKEEFGIEDPEVLQAIRFHTTGSEKMSQLDKIIFLADYIEPGRSCPGIDEVRELAYVDLDQAIILAAGRTIVYEINRNNPIHLRTVKTRNTLLRKGERDGNS